MQDRHSLIHTILLTLMAIFLATFAGNTTVQAATMTTKAKIEKRGLIKVGMDIFQPWAMRDKNGNLIGFEIDVATRLAKDMGVEVEFIPTAWSGIIPALLTGKFDVIIGGMGITEERKKQVDFTIPYDYSGMSIVANKKLAAGFDSLEAFNKKGVEIAVKTGTTAAAAAKEYLPLATLRMFDSEPQTYQELRNGNVFAVVGSAPRPAYEAIAYPESLFLPVQGTFTKEPIGFALRKGDAETLAWFNSWITKVEKEGWLQKHHHYWFGTKDWSSQVE